MTEADYTLAELAAVLADAAAQLHLLGGEPPASPAGLRPADQGIEQIARCPLHGEWVWRGRCRIGGVR
jgi:hypothetical protein